VIFSGTVILTISSVTFSTGIVMLVMFSAGIVTFSMTSGIFSGGNVMFYSILHSVYRIKRLLL